MSPHTILFVHSSDPNDNIGGGEASLLALAERLDRSRFRPIMVVSGEGEYSQKLRAAGLDTRILSMDPMYVTVSQANPMRLLVLAFKALISTLRLAILIQRDGVDLVCTNVQGAHLYGGFAARLAGRPQVMYMRDIPQGSFSTRLFPWIARHLAKRVICISNAVREFFSQHPRFGPQLAGKCRVVFNGIDVSALAPREPSSRIREELGLHDAYPVVTLIGRLQPWKGQHDFLQAAAMLRHRFPRARFLLVGEVFKFQEDYKKQLQRLVVDNDLGAHVVFTGQRQDIGDILSATDIVVSASHHEPFGRVIIEAMAMARPVVATRAGGIPDIVADASTGYLVAPESPAALAEAIAEVASDEGKATAMGARGRERVEAEFSIESTVRNASLVFETT